MSNYTPSTNFAAKDALSPGDPAKKIKGVEISAEFSAIQTAVNSKYDSTTVVPVSAGGTGATTAAAARASLAALTAGDNIGAATATTATVGDNSTKVATTAFVATAAAAVAVPAGSVFYFAANAAPSGYLECNGAAVSRTTYAALFAVVGTVWGIGDGSTTFNLPDLRGEFIRGWDNGRGVDSGRAFASYQADAFQGHVHTADQVSAVANGIGANTWQWQRDAAKNTSSPVTDGVNGTPRTASETRPRNKALMACIKY